MKIEKCLARFHKFCFTFFRTFSFSLHKSALSKTTIENGRNKLVLFDTNFWRTVPEESLACFAFKYLNRCVMALTTTRNALQRNQH